MYTHSVPTHIILQMKPESNCSITVIVVVVVAVVVLVVVVGVEH